jgi:uncharacterized membrane protein
MTFQSQSQFPSSIPAFSSETHDFIQSAVSGRQLDGDQIQSKILALRADRQKEMLRIKRAKQAVKRALAILDQHTNKKLAILDQHEISRLRAALRQNEETDNEEMDLR